MGKSKEMKGVGEREITCIKVVPPADSMKPNKLRCHLKTLQRNHANKPLELFKLFIVAVESGDAKCFLLPGGRNRQ